MLNYKYTASNYLYKQKEFNAKKGHNKSYKKYNYFINSKENEGLEMLKIANKNTLTKQILLLSNKSLIESKQRERKEILRRIKEFMIKYNFSSRIYLFAINLFDFVYLKNSLKIPPYILGLVSVLLSLKFLENEKNVPSLKKIFSFLLLNQQFSSIGEVEQAEVLVLKEINYDLTFPNIYTYIMLIYYTTDITFPSEKNTIRNAELLLEKGIEYIFYDQFNLACALLSYLRITTGFEKWTKDLEIKLKVKSENFERELRFIEEALGSNRNVNNNEHNNIYPVYSGNKNNNNINSINNANSSSNNANTNNASNNRNNYKKNTGIKVNRNNLNRNYFNKNQITSGGTIQFEYGKEKDNKRIYQTYKNNEFIYSNVERIEDKRKFYNYDEEQFERRPGSVEATKKNYFNLNKTNDYPTYNNSRLRSNSKGNTYLNNNNQNLNQSIGSVNERIINYKSYNNNPNTNPSSNNYQPNRNSNYKTSYKATNNLKIKGFNKVNVFQEINRNLSYGNYFVSHSLTKRYTKNNNTDQRTNRNKYLNNTHNTSKEMLYERSGSNPKMRDSFSGVKYQTINNNNNSSKASININDAFISISKPNTIRGYIYNPTSNLTSNTNSAQSTIETNYNNLRGNSLYKNKNYYYGPMNKQNLNLDSSYENDQPYNKTFYYQNESNRNFNNSGGFSKSNLYQGYTKANKGLSINTNINANINIIGLRRNNFYTNANEVPKANLYYGQNNSNQNNNYSLSNSLNKRKYSYLGNIHRNETNEKRDTDSNRVGVNKKENEIGSASGSFGTGSLGTGMGNNYYTKRRNQVRFK
ncbi:MAG: hypothetical protein MJ252_04475 [archaeon]|nr:hypothetical protein [archaeon]